MCRRQCTCIIISQWASSSRYLQASAEVGEQRVCSWMRDGSVVFCVGLVYCKGYLYVPCNVIVVNFVY
jgi:hypothetical protein